MAHLDCEHCGVSVLKRNLLRHQKSGTCLKAQGRRVESAFQCEWCGDGFNRPDTFRKHTGGCKQKYKMLYTSTEDQLREDNKRLSVKVASQDVEIEECGVKLAELELENKLLRKEISVLKAVPPIVNHITNNIRVDKFVVQQYAKDNFSALTDGVLKQCLSVAVDPRLLLRGPEAVAQLILETSLEGRDKVACTDTSRAVCFWKDIDHTVITDMKMRKLMPRLVRPIHNAYNAAWRKDDSMCGDQYREIGDVIHRLNMIAQKRDVKSKYYNALSRIIMDAKCDLLYMLTEEDEQERDEDGNSMSSDSE